MAMDGMATATRQVIAAAINFMLRSSWVGDK
jgi:hypothetical protein